MTLPDFSLLGPYDRDILSTINYPSTNGLIATSNRSDNLGIVFTGYVNVTSTNVYQFYVTSDDGSKLYLGNTLVMNNDGSHGMIEGATALIGLKAGKHLVRIEYFEGGGGAGVIASWSGTGVTKAVIPASRWFVVPPNCTADFDGDGDTGTDFDISAFFACLGGNCCTACGSADFDGDGDFGTDFDIQSFFRVLGGGPC